MVEGFQEIERQCDLSFAWVVHVGSWLLYSTDEVHYIVKHDSESGRHARINMHGMHAGHAGGAGRARFSFKSA